MRKCGARIAILLGALTVPLLRPVPLAPQVPGEEVRMAFGELPAPDSERVREGARDAQRRFERVRRRHLPRGWGGGWGRCDEVVGRYCLWHDGEDWEPPEEPDEVTAAREDLLARLGEAATKLPGDGWVAGQRVRYLVEAGRADDGVRAARACRAEPWWCRALEGYARHAAGQAGTADSLFADVLRELPRERRCRWTDLELLLEGEGADRYRDFGCEEREAFAQAFWALSDPLWAAPGNDRRTEHFARHVLHLLQRDAASGYGARWGDDLRELLIRYGWPAGWERVRRGGATGSESLVAHDPPGSRRYVPVPAWAFDPAVMPPDGWEFDPRSPRTHYASGYLREVRALAWPDLQVAAFRREGRVVLVAGWDVRPAADTLPPCSSARSLLGVEAAGGERRLVEGRGAERERLALSAPRPSAGSAAVVGIERFCPAERWAARARFGHGFGAAGPDAVLSDLLVLTSGDTLPEDLEGAATRARTSLRVGAGERLGLFWEYYPDGTRGEGGAPSRVRVSLRREGGGFLRGLTDFLGLTDSGGEAVGMEWRERAGGPVVPRAVALTLPEDLDDGRYTLEVEVEMADGTTAVTDRRLEVER